MRDGISRPVVVTAADRRAILPALALIQSLALNSQGTRLLLLAIGLVRQEESRLLDLATGAGLDLQIVPMDPACLQGATLRSSHLSRAAYARLFLPQTLLHLDRVIWLDADTLVLSDLVPLWETNLEGALIAAVPDDFIDAEEIAATGSRKGAYCNSGVMVVDLARWRRDGLQTQALELMTRPDLICEDQSVLNRLCVGQIKLLDARWNFHAGRFAEYMPAQRRVAPAILHYCGARKPWREPVPFGDVFLSYLPNAHRIRIAEGFERKSRFRRAKLLWRRLFGLVAFRKKHWRATAAAAVLKLAERRVKRRRNAAGRVWTIMAGGHGHPVIRPDTFDDP